MPLQPSALHFFFSHTSASCARIRIAAHLKKIPLNLHPIKTAEDSREGNASLDMRYRQAIPTLTAYYRNGQQLDLTQSMSMLDYLEEVYPEDPRLLPPVTYMRQRVMAREMANLIAGFDSSSGAMSTWSGKPPDGDEEHDAWHLLNISRCLDLYERLVGRSARRYSLGDELSIADVCLVPLVQSGEDVGLQTHHWHSINSIVTECRKIDAFRDATLQARR